MIKMRNPIETSELMKYGKEIIIGMSYIRLFKGSLCLYIVLLFLSLLTEGLGLGMIIPVLQSMQGDKSSNIFTDTARDVFAWAGFSYTFTNIIVLFGVVMLVKYVFMYGQQYAARVLSASVTCELRERAFNNLMNLPLAYFYRQKIGNIVATLYTSSNNSGGLIENAALMIMGIVFCMVYIILNLLISLPLTAIACGVSVTLYLLIIPRFRIGFIQGTEEKQITDRISSFIMDKFAGIKTLKSFNKEDMHKGEFNALARAFRGLQIKIQNNRILADMCLEPLVTVMIIVLLIASVTIFHLSMAAIITFFYIFSRIIPKLKQINGNYLQIMNMLPHFSKIHSLIRYDDKKYLPDGDCKVEQIEKGILFKNVSFRYPGAKSSALKNINLFIEKNKTTALVGVSGGGKTTLVDLLIRHHDPSDGLIYVDNKDLRNVRCNDWHHLIAMVEQDPYLFNDTIYNNIRYGKIGTGMEEVQHAAKLANAYDFIEQLPLKYETVVGERGIKLSGGQKQRIALARALIKDPAILVLDEATSSLDTESEKFIQESIEKFSNSKTIVIIAHRLSTIKQASWIVVVEHGEIIEQGAPEELLAEGNAYAKYYSLQFGAK